MICKNFFSAYKESSCAALAQGAVFASGLLNSRFLNNGIFSRLIINVIIIIKHGRASGLIQSF